jgi:hypothetical protein
MLGACGVRASWQGPVGGQKGNIQVVDSQNGAVWAGDSVGGVWALNPATQAWNLEVAPDGNAVGAITAESFGAWESVLGQNLRLTCPNNDCTQGLANVTNVGGPALHSIVGPNIHQAWGIDDNGRLNHWDNAGTFQQVAAISDPLTQAAMSPWYDGGSGCSTLWVIDTRGNLLQCTDTVSGSVTTYTFTVIPLPSGVLATHVAVGDNQNVWIVPSNGDGVWRLNPLTSAWTFFNSTTPFIELRVAQSQSSSNVPADVWAADGPGNVFRIFAGSFVSAGKNVTTSVFGQRLAVGSHGDDVWEIGTDNNVYNW